jgi:hypothetical protein
VNSLANLKASNSTQWSPISQSGAHFRGGDIHIEGVEKIEDDEQKR